VIAGGVHLMGDSRQAGGCHPPPPTPPPPEPGPPGPSSAPCDAGTVVPRLQALDNKCPAWSDSATVDSSDCDNGCASLATVFLQDCSGLLERMSLGSLVDTLSAAVSDCASAASTCESAQDWMDATQVIDENCCGGGNCPQGLPTTCDSDQCADVLIPLQAKCAKPDSFLSSTSWTASIKGDLAKLAAECSVWSQQSALK
jgi:hypothetical protein